MIGFAVILLTVWIVLVLSSIPLLISVRMMGGEASIARVILTNLLVGLVGVLLYYQFPMFSGILSLIALLLVYSMMFRISVIRAAFAWLIQGVIAFLLLLAAVFLFGIPIMLIA